MSDDYEVNWLGDGAIFTINRPARLNALTKSVLDGLATCLDTLEQRKLRMLVVTGRGDKAFCAGTDLVELQSMPAPARLAKGDMARALLVRLSRSTVISVAAINGLALGGGLELAMACTFRVAAAHAMFGLPEVKLGLLPAYAGTQFLPVIVGRARAEELLLTGRTIALDEALAIGLIHRASPADPVLAALDLACEVTINNPAAVAAIRDCINACGADVSDVGLDVERARVNDVFSTPEAEQGVADFLSKRGRFAKR